MKPIIEAQDKTPRDTATFRLPKPLVERYKAYCASLNSAPSYVMEKILSTWLTEAESMKKG